MKNNTMKTMIILTVINVILFIINMVMIFLL